MGSFGTDPVRKCLEEDSNPFVHRLRVNIGVCGLIKADSTKNFEGSNMDLKERLLRGEISSIAWLPTKDMWADMLTKEMKLPEALDCILTRNDMWIENAFINEVKAHGQEVRMSNICNRREVHVPVDDIPGLR